MKQKTSPMKFIVKTTGLLFINLFIITFFANAQVITIGPPTWDGSTVNTFTKGRAAVGCQTTDATLQIKTQIPVPYVNTSLRIYNDVCPNCLVSDMPLGLTHNVFEIIPRTFVPTGGDDEDIRSVGNPYLVVNRAGQVGVGVLPDHTKNFNFDVDGQSHFSDKMLIGNYSVTMPSNYMLYVEKGILTERIKVASHTDPLQWSDFVFNDDYKLKPLDEVHNYIKQNKHLPDVPSASDVAKDGIDLAKMDATLLQKIEELTLYMIELKKENAQLKKDVQALKKK